MAALLAIIQVFLIISAIILIVTVLLQQGNTAGLGALGGGAETFLGKNKAKSYEGRLELATKVSAAVFVVLAIVMCAIQAHI